MTALSGELFAGTGMLGRAVGEVFGTRPAWFCEFDAAPSKVLAHHYPDVPNYGDVTKVDFTTVPHTHVRAGGFPCQDVSVSGARAGLRDGTRSGLWSEFARSIAEDRPDWVVIENVGGLLSAEAHSDVEPCPWCLGEEPGEPALRALGAVLADLAALGFDAEWTSIRASDVGAPHGRLRVFILAWPAERTLADTAGERRSLAIASGREAGSRAAQSDRASAPNTDDRTGDRERARAGSQVGGAEAGVTLLPTPTVVMNDGESVESWSARRDRVKATGVNGNGMGMPLPIAVQLLPTPTASEGEHGGPGRTYGDGSPTLGGIASLLPTPRASRGGSATETMYGLGATRVDDERAQGQVTLLPTSGAYDGERGGSQHPDKRRDGGHSITLQDVAEHALLGMPRTAHGMMNTLRDPAAIGNPRGRFEDQIALLDAESWGPYAAAIARWEQVMGRLAPSPVRMDGKGGKARLNPELTEWMMGWPFGWVTASVIGLSRAEQLKACGNGVVLQQAIAALRMLLTRLGVPAVEWEMAA
jgi:DNA (cytosine-5)-methyltransferase 1